MYKKNSIIQQSNWTKDKQNSHLVPSALEHDLLGKVTDGHAETVVELRYAVAHRLYLVVARLRVALLLPDRHRQSLMQ